MWKYIVTYYIMIIVVCPPVIDEFGRESVNNATVHLVFTEPCFRLDSVKKARTFNSLDSAHAFTKRGEREADLRNFKIDSVSALQYNCTHPYGSSTAMGCNDTPCNTFTCGKCGKQWPTY